MAKTLEKTGNQERVKTPLELRLEKIESLYTKAIEGMLSAEDSEKLREANSKIQEYQGRLAVKLEDWIKRGAAAVGNIASVAGDTAFEVLKVVGEAIGKGADVTYQYYQKKKEGKKK